MRNGLGIKVVRLYCTAYTRHHFTITSPLRHHFTPTSPLRHLTATSPPLHPHFATSPPLHHFATTSLQIFFFHVRICNIAFNLSRILLESYEPDTLVLCSSVMVEALGSDFRKPYETRSLTACCLSFPSVK